MIERKRVEEKCRVQSSSQGADEIRSLTGGTIGLVVWDARGVTVNIVCERHVRAQGETKEDTSGDVAPLR